MLALRASLVPSLVVLSLVGAAPRASGQLAPPAAAGSGGAAAPALAAALDRIDAAAIGADLRFLASEELGGRDTPSPGLRVAALYLATRLARLGLEPCRAGEEDGLDPRAFLVAERWPAVLLDRARTGAALVPDVGHERGLVFGEDWFFHGGGLFAFEAQGPLLWVGGASEPELAGLSLTGAFALVGAVPEEAWAARLGALRARGVAGVLLAPTTPALAALRERAAELVGERMERPWLRTARDAPPQVLLTARGLARLGLAEPLPAPGRRLGRWRERRAVTAAEPRDGLALENVAGFLRGSDPLLAEEVLLVCAHYDHLGAPGGVVHPGADDNASGVAALLAAAGALAQAPPRRSVAFLLFAGEEHGQQGSRAWARAPALPPGARPAGALNLDMVGRNAPRALAFTPSPAHPRDNAVARALARLAPAEGFDAVGDDGLWERSDHLPLATVLDLPVVGVCSGEHADYHRPSDRAEAIDLDKVRRVARLVVRVVHALDGEGALPLEAGAPH